MNWGSICHFLATCLFLQEAFLGVSLAVGAASLLHGCTCAPSWLQGWHRHTYFLGRAQGLLPFC